MKFGYIEPFKFIVLTNPDLPRPAPQQVPIPEPERYSLTPFVRAILHDEHGTVQ